MFYATLQDFQSRDVELALEAYVPELPEPDASIFCERCMDEGFCNYGNFFIFLKQNRN